jgi:hypothetical protein
LSTSRRSPQEAGQGQQLVLENLLLLQRRLRLDCVPQCVQLAGVRLGQSFLLLSELDLQFLAVLLVVGVLLFALCELGLKTRFPLSLGLLVGVDLAGSEEIVEGDTGIRCEYRVDLLSCAL